MKIFKKLYWYLHNKITQRRLKKYFPQKLIDEELSKKNSLYSILKNERQKTKETKK